MDKVLSARVDETVLNRIGALAHRLRVSKKKVIENAVNFYADQVQDGRSLDFLAATHGAWVRREPAAKTVARARAAFRQSMDRHRR